MPYPTEWEFLAFGFVAAFTYAAIGVVAATCFAIALAFVAIALVIAEQIQHSMKSNGVHHGNG